MAIGVFDSGIGGLSVHAALVRALPRADFIYLADQANAPYGRRQAEEIVALTREGCQTLFAQGANLVVLACNTAASIALRPLQQEWLPGHARLLGRSVNILGLIVPTIETVTGLPWRESDAPARAAATGGIVGIFATPATVRSDVYAEEIHKRRPDMRVVQEACPDLARMIEAGADKRLIDVAVETHVRALSARIGADGWQAILGCTHYEIAAGSFRRFLPSGVRLIHQPDATAQALKRYLARHPDYDAGENGARRFLTTDRSQGRQAAPGLEEAPAFEKISSFISGG